MRARESFAPCPLRHGQPEPLMLAARSSSRIPRSLPSSSCSLGLKA